MRGKQEALLHGLKEKVINLNNKVCNGHPVLQLRGGGTDTTRSPSRKFHVDFLCLKIDFFLSWQPSEIVMLFAPCGKPHRYLLI